MRKATGSLGLLLACMLIFVGSASAEVVRGKVANIDLKGNRVAVQTTDGKDHSFTFDPQDFIVWKGDDEVKAEEIKTGTDAEIGYYADETGKEIASWVDLTPAAEGEGVSVPAPVAAAAPTAMSAPAAASTPASAPASEAAPAAPEKPKTQ